MQRVTGKMLAEVRKDVAELTQFSDRAATNSVAMAAAHIIADALDKLTDEMIALRKSVEGDPRVIRKAQNVM